MKVSNDKIKVVLNVAIDEPMLKKLVVGASVDFAKGEIDEVPDELSDLLKFTKREGENGMVIVIVDWV